MFATRYARDRSLRHWTIALSLSLFVAYGQSNWWSVLPTRPGFQISLRGGRLAHRGGAGSQISGFEISEGRRWGGETTAGGAPALQNDKTDGEARRQSGVATTQAKLRRRHELGAFAVNDNGVSSNSAPSNSACDYRTTCAVRPRRGSG